MYWGPGNAGDQDTHRGNAIQVHVIVYGRRVGRICQNK